MNAKKASSASPSTSPPLSNQQAPTPCTVCGTIFANQATFDAHHLTDEQRNPPSIKYLKGEPFLPKCLSASSLWARGWVRYRSPSKSAAERKVAAIWSKPLAVTVEPKVKARTGEEWVCVLCNKAFASVIGFKAHHVHVFTKAERCLDADELRTLHFELDAARIWRISNQTQHLPSQIARLPSVRPAIEAQRCSELDGPADAPFNMCLDPNDSPPGAHAIYEDTFTVGAP